LKLLGHAVRAGHSIGRVANLTESELQSIGAGDAIVDRVRQSGEATDYVERTKKAILAIDPGTLEDTLVLGAAHLGLGRLTEEVLTELLDYLNIGWESGDITIAMEHVASATIRAYLDRARLSLEAQSSAPLVAVTTPSGQHHELGAMMVALLIALEGCRSVYLGPNMPASDIAQAASKLKAAAIAISIVHPKDDPDLPREIERIRILAPDHIRIWVGGRAAPHYAKAMKAANAQHITDLAALRQMVRQLV
jgi:methanogenic corrinoid protein MtbC1